MKNDLTPQTTDKNKDKRTERDAVMPLLLCRLVRDMVAFCSFPKTHELMPAKKKNQEQQVCKRKELTQTKIDWQI
jgi:hypothetical protein